ncbi:probable glutathione S-transferase [Neltuma alba]|uniref:probable glutathione S-transferase n=1 Tax=Neltuma alba TaxID=207710 RepID=UPI0010A580FA|nr:probable glutathione S-transferase [Prosopis alba]XP_028796566.1 probable glutathione S-transferase [Prosopis alba]
MASNQQVKLFGIVGSPFVTRAEIALKLKGAEYEYVHESLTDKSDLLLRYNPVHKMVPVLLHNDKPICESLVIVEYVDETFTGYPILPSDPHHRALARFWSKFIDDKVLPAISKAAWNPDAREREKGGEESSEALKTLENELKGKFFNGDSMGYVDITALFLAFWLPLIEEAGALELFSGEKFPKLKKWSHEILKHPIVKEALPPKDVLIGYYKTRFQSIAASK